MDQDNAYELLGLTPDAGLREVEGAYQRLSALYAEDSMAIYTLFDEDQRRQRLLDIEAAFQRIVAAAGRLPGGESAEAAGPAPDPQTHPGLYLGWVRRQAGLSLRVLAERSKLGVRRLEDIEQERYKLLPPPVYLRGFVLEYARMLGLAEARQLAEDFLALAAAVAERE